jgi:hypothetical protein
MNPRMLSKYCSFDDLTKTSNAALQVQNRVYAEAFIKPLTSLALLLDIIWEAAGPLDFHSGFRCDVLNGGIAGSSKTSQHPKGEAVDISPKGVDTELSISAFFGQVQEILAEKRLPFGQLIKESAARSYGKVWWVHLSLGAPYREQAKCGQVFTMLDGKRVGDIRILNAGHPGGY